MRLYYHDITPRYNRQKNDFTEKPVLSASKERKEHKEKQKTERGKRTFPLMWQHGTHCPKKHLSIQIIKDFLNKLED